MSLFDWKAKREGWLGVRAAAGRLAAVHVVRGRKQGAELRALIEFDSGGDLARDLLRLRRAAGAMRANCVAALEPAQYRLLQVDAPPVPAAERKEALRWRLKDMLDFPCADALIDALEVPAPDGRARQLLAVAAPRRELRPLVEAYLAAHLGLEAIDIAESAYRNLATALAAQAGESERGHALLVLDAGGGVLVFVWRGELVQARRIESTAASVAADQRYDAFDRLGLELQRSLDMFERAHSHIGLSRLWLAAAGATEQLCAFLASNLYLPVEALDLGALLDLSAAPALRSPETAAPFLVPLGLALRTEAA
ncbi:MAG: hypothetical protein KF778_10835 [Rhodocyclaceae bacterium]|nr:hypothetical protein [Rhodocyclaceae bacterium]